MPDWGRPARRVQLFFFCQFLSVGMINAYAGIWFDSIGLTPAQIGIIGAVPVAILFFVTVFVGRLADRARDWRQVIVIGAVAAGLFPIGLFFFGGFWGVMLVWACMAVAQRLIVPVADAAAIRMARREGFDFGGIRALATIGYLLVILIAGYVLSDMGVAVFLPIFVALGLVRAAAAFALPRMRSDSAPKATAEMARFSSVMKPWFVLPLLGWALIDTNHILLNAFQGLLWAKQGISTEVIGVLITLGAAAETVMFFSFRHFAAGFSPLTLLIVTAIASVVRWVAMALEPGVSVLVVLQLMHAITYALGFLACTNFIADSTSEDNAAEAQSFLVMLELALSAFALAGFGWLAGIWGANAYFAAAVTAGVGGLVVFAGRKWQTRTAS